MKSAEWGSGILSEEKGTFCLGWEGKSSTRIGSSCSACNDMHDGYKGGTVGGVGGRWRGRYTRRKGVAEAEPSDYIYGGCQAIWFSKEILMSASERSHLLLRMTSETGSRSVTSMELRDVGARASRGH